MTIHRHVGCLCLAAMTAMTAQAGEFQFSGFGSFIAGMRDHETPTQYAGYTHTDFAFEPDSLIGIQASVQATDKATVTVQLVSRGSEEWSTEVDWAYVQYAVTDELSWRLGRIRVPFYLYSDYLSVGYAYPWITPPNEVYNIPFSNVNGGDVVFLHSFGSFDLLLQGYVGSEKFTFGPTSPLAGNEGQTRNQFGLISELTWRSFKFRYAYHGAKVYGDNTGKPIETLVDNLIAAGETKTADRFTIDRDYYDFHDLAAQYDDGTYLFIAETIILSAHDDSPASTNKASFVTGGYRFGSMMAMLTYGFREDSEDDLVQDMTLPPTHPLYLAAAGAQESTVIDTEQWTLGYRWDFTDGMTFKAEVVDWTDNKDSDNDSMLTRAGIQVVF